MPRNHNPYFTEDDRNRSNRNIAKMRWKMLGLLVNWLFVVVLAIFGFSLLMHHVDNYQSEKLYYRLVNEGTVPEDQENPYLREGVRRNMEFKGKTIKVFFLVSWSKKIPVYLGFILLPLIVAIIRLRQKEPSWLDWVYYVILPATCIYMGYMGLRFLGYL